jgi:hypothetical protein
MLVYSILPLMVLACSSDGSTSSSSTSGSTSSTSGSTSSSGQSSGNTPAPFTCGTETCDALTSYCALIPKGKELVAAGCKAYPAGCSAPKIDSTCKRRDPAECARAGRPVTECLEVPAACKAETTCDCIAKTKSCPQSGAVITNCSAANNQVSFACYN